MTIKYGWSRDVLLNKINSDDFSRSIPSQTNFDLTIDPKYKDQAVLAIKGDYLFESIGLSDEHSEKELENAITSNIEKFLLEMNNEFTFVGRHSTD